MSHPLVGDLSNLTDDELLIKINDLSTRSSKAYRAGYTDAVNQLQMILSDYRYEQQRRHDKMMQDISDKSGKDWDGIINIG